MSFPRLIGHTCLTAGAGAGKTRRLVETYVGLLSEGIAPHEIVAITFTEKAAAEMRTRVVNALAGMAAQGAPGPEWRRLLPQVEWAPISTIHSYCVSLLREFGAALGIDPDFRVMEAEEHHDILQETLEDILRREMQQASPRLTRLIAHYPLSVRGGIRERLADALDALATSGISPAEAARNSALAHAEALEQTPGILAELEGLIRGLALERSGGSLMKSKAAFVQKVDQLIVLWPEIKAKFTKSLQDDDIHDQLYLLTGGGWGKTNEVRRQMRALTDELRGLAAMPQSAELTADFLSLLTDLHHELNQELQRRATVSFDALLTGARDLLKHSPQVLAALRQRYKAVLVDEYQDVNPVQGELVELLAGVNGDPLGLGQPRLLVVGDRKQSIYAFRGAEVSLYTRTMQQFEQGQGRVEALPNNWRSAHRLVDFFNRLFPQVFLPGAKAQHEASFYVNFRPDDHQDPARQQPEPQGACVEVLGIEPDQEVSCADEWRRLEAQALGAYIRDLTRNQGVKPGEIAVLFRRLTQVEQYEWGLNLAGVDFYTLRGRGFFACQEIKDLYYALRAALHEHDDLALAAWLRSPMLGLSDEALLGLVHGGRGSQSLNGGLMGSVELAWLDPVELERIGFARETLKRLRGLARRMRPFELVEAIIEECDYTAVLLGAPGGEQRAANLRKLIEMCREPGAAGPGSIEDFTRYLGEMLSEPAKESKAPLLGEDAQVVRLMTIHQSKGLEFPVVILPDLAGTDTRPAQFIPPSPEGVFSLQPRDFISNALKNNPLHAWLRNIDQARQEAETARLFYVACTRATERLAFCLNQAPRQTVWGKWVRELVLPDPETRQIMADELDPMAQTDGPETPVPAISPALRQEAEDILRRCLQPEPPRAHLVRESVSGLEDWFTCPRRYYFTRVLGLDTAVLQPAYSTEGPGSMGDGSPVSLGSRVHRILERAPLWQGPDCMGEADSGPDGLDLACSLARGIYQTELSDIITNLQPEQVFREQGFQLAIEDGAARVLEVIGEIDLLLVSPEGLVVIDYKVSRHVAPQDYALQLKLYTLAAWRAAGRPNTPPRAGICYLKDDGAELHWFEFTLAQLNGLELELCQAGKDIASLPLEPVLSDFRPGPGCKPACSLAQAGLCQAED